MSFMVIASPVVGSQLLGELPVSRGCVQEKADTVQHVKKQVACGGGDGCEPGEASGG
jgi:hypothetical protein